MCQAALTPALFFILYVSPVRSSYMLAVRAAHCHLCPLVLYVLAVCAQPQSHFAKPVNYLAGSLLDSSTFVGARPRWTASQFFVRSL